MVTDINKKRLELLKDKYLDAVSQSADFFALGEYVIYYKRGEGLKVMRCGETGVEVIFEAKL